MRESEKPIITNPRKGNHDMHLLQTAKKLGVFTPHALSKFGEVSKDVARSFIRRMAGRDLIKPMPAGLWRLTGELP